MSSITITKFAIFFLLKKYRKVFKGNLRKVVIVGLNKKTDQLRKYFNDNPDYGYQLVKIFDLKQYQNKYSFEFHGRSIFLQGKLLSKNLLTKRNALNDPVFAPIGSRWLDALIVLIAAETIDLYTPFKAPKPSLTP